MRSHPERPAASPTPLASAVAEPRRARQTIPCDLEFEGLGLHGGRPATIALRSAPAGTGRVFRRRRGATTAIIPGLVRYVVATDRATTLSHGGVSVDTVEHVLAALYGLGVDDAYLDVEGAEVPILDGSAQPFVEAIRRAGGPKPARVDDAHDPASGPAPTSARVIRQTVEVRDGERWARLEPAARFEVDVVVDYPGVGRQRFSGPVDVDCFVEEIGPARTFGFVSEAASLEAHGRAKGASFACAVVFDPHGTPLNAEGLRFSDEVVRHKVLDVLGDLALSGVPLVGRYVAERPGHGLNVALVRALRRMSPR